MVRKLGVAFAGGGIKSICQISLLKELERKNIKPDFVSGASAGAMIAALTAMGLSAEEVYQEINQAIVEIDQQKVFKISGRDLLFNKDLKHGVLDSGKVEKIVDTICLKYNVHHISDVKIPLAITAVDLQSGELIVFVSHPELYQNTHDRTVIISDISMAKALRATMSYPMVFSSVEFQGRTLIDGGVRMNCPVPMLKDYGADKTIAITMRGDIDEVIDVKGTFQLAGRVFEIVSREAEFIHSHSVDYLLNIPVGHVNIFDMDISEQIVDLGNQTIANQQISFDQFIDEEQGFINKLSSFFNRK